jgi:K+-transporting ATPase A subunit
MISKELRFSQPSLPSSSFTEYQSDIVRSTIWTAVPSCTTTASALLSDGVSFTLADGATTTALSRASKLCFCYHANNVEKTKTKTDSKAT